MYCPECGQNHHAIAEETATEETAMVEEAADAAVEVARIEAERDVTLAKLDNKALEREEEMQLASLEAEVRALREMIAAMAPAPAEETPEEEQPVEVVVAEGPGAEAEAENIDDSVVSEPEPPTPPTPPTRKKSNPWWK